MKKSIINLTHPIDGVQYGVLDEQIKDYDWVIKNGQIFKFLSHLWEIERKECKKIICSTKTKDQRFPYLQLPTSKRVNDIYYVETFKL